MEREKRTEYAISMESGTIWPKTVSKEKKE